MPLDPAAERFLEVARAAPQPYETSLEEFRAAADRLVGNGDAEEVGRVDDLVIAGGDGQPLRLRLYVPSAKQPLPTIVWLHGGSFVRGTLETFDGVRRALANALGCVVVAVDQRLAPEARFPAPLEDAYAAVSWTVDHAAEIGGDPTRVGVGGESSGGNLAATTALLARERGGPALAVQVLVAPLLDATCSEASIKEFGEGYVLTRAQLEWCYEQYAPGVPRRTPLLSPLHEPDLRGLPPAVVVTVEFDPVRDEGEHHARRLEEAGVTVRHARLEGMVHHFPGPEAIDVISSLVRATLDAEAPLLGPGPT